MTKLSTDHMGRKAGDPGTALHALRAIMARTKPQAAQKPASAAAQPKLATPAPRAMTATEARADMRKAIAGSQGKSVAEVFGSAPPAPAAPPVSSSAVSVWDAVIATQRAKIEKVTRHAR